MHYLINPLFSTKKETPTFDHIFMFTYITKIAESSLFADYMMYRWH